MLISELYTTEKVLYCERCRFSHIDAHQVGRLGEKPYNPRYICSKDENHKRVVDAYGYCYEAKPAEFLLKRCSDYKKEEDDAKLD